MRPATLRLVQQWVEQSLQIAALEQPREIRRLGPFVGVNSPHDRAGHPSTGHQHDLVGGKRRGVRNTWNGLDLIRQTVVILKLAGALREHPKMGVDAEQPLLESCLESAHHRENDDQHHDADGHSAHRDDRDQRDEPLAPTGHEIAQAHEQFVHWGIIRFHVAKGGRHS